LGDEGLTALSTGLKMVTSLNICNRTNHLEKWRAGPNGLTAIINSLEQLKYLKIGNYKKSRLQQNGRGNNARHRHGIRNSVRAYCFIDV
jgi:hypothetical protein